MKICVISARYALSGVPLAQLRFARALAKINHNVDLIYGTINHGCNAPLVPEVNLILQHKNRVLTMLFPLINYLRKSKPDIIFSAGDHLNLIVIIAAIVTRSKAKISCSSRVTPYDTYSNIFFTKRWFLKKLMQLFMVRANVLSCVSQDMVYQYQKIFKNSPHICIYNIIENSYSRNLINEDVSEDWFVNNTDPIIIAAGNLVVWKGFADLIHAFSHVLKKRKARLIILGDGPERSNLLELIERLDLCNFVKLLGYVDNPLKYFKRSRIFVLSSHVEGLPNVLVEAMMCGCTPVSINCPTGPREVLQDGKYGYLVRMGDTLELAEYIIKAIDNPIPLDKLHEAITPFSESEVISKHFSSLGLTQ